MCCMKWCRNNSLLETTRLQENLGRSAIFIFIEKLLLILGDCANQFLFFFPFLLVPSPITLPGVYFIFICSTKRVSSLGGIWAQLDKYVYVDFLSILPSKESSVTNLLNLSKLLLSKCQ